MRRHVVVARTMAEAQSYLKSMGERDLRNWIVVTQSLWTTGDGWVMLRGLDQPQVVVYCCSLTEEQRDLLTTIRATVCYAEEAEV